MSVKVIKNSKKIELFKKVVSLFEADKDYMLDTVIPGAYRKTCIMSEPTDADLVCVGHTAGALYYVPKQYKQVFNICDAGYWNYRITCPITGESTVVSAHLGNSAEARLLLEGKD